MAPNNSYKRNKKKTRRRTSFWVLKITLLTFIIAYLFSVFSEVFVRRLNSILFAGLSMFIIIIIGVLFDMIGIAVTSASDTPFVSMASKRIRGANQAIRLVKNADQVSSFCNDVVGDICGIVSGATGSILVVKLLSMGFSLEHSILSIIISSLIAAFTVAGKAVGKVIAIRNNQSIVYFAGYLLSFFNSDERKKRKVFVRNTRERFK